MMVALRIIAFVMIMINKYSCDVARTIRRNKKDGGCRFYHNTLRT